MNSKKRNRARNQAPRCPYCGRTSILRSTEGIYRGNSRNTMLYVCRNYPVCDAYVRVQPGSHLPVGTMANGKLRALRKDAHHCFDQLFKRGLMTKEEAYRWLASILAAPIEQAHIGLLGEYYCGVVIQESRILLQRHPGKMNYQKVGQTVLGQKVQFLRH